MTILWVSLFAANLVFTMVGAYRLRASNDNGDHFYNAVRLGLSIAGMICAVALAFEAKHHP